MKENYLAIALGKRDIGEADRLYVFYTREQGLLYVGAKGVRKSVAKLAPHIEDYMLSNITIAKNYGPGRLAGAHVEESYGRIREDYELMCSLRAMRMIFVRVTDLGQRDDTVFGLLMECLDVLHGLYEKDLGDLSRAQNLIVSAFLLKLYNAMGYEFPLSQCAKCSTKLQASKNYFSAFDGGVLCAECGRAAPYASAIEPDTIKVMRLIISHSLPSIQKVVVSQIVANQLQMITDQTAKWIMR